MSDQGKYLALRLTYSLRGADLINKALNKNTLYLESF